MRLENKFEKNFKYIIEQSMQNKDFSFDNEYIKSDYTVGQIEYLDCDILFEGYLKDMDMDEFLAESEEIFLDINDKNNEVQNNLKDWLIDRIVDSLFILKEVNENVDNRICFTNINLDKKYLDKSKIKKDFDLEQIFSFTENKKIIISTHFYL